MIDISELMRDPLKESRAYIAGQAIPAALMQPGVVKLNANENQYGPSPMAIKAMARELQNGNLYPQSVMQALREKIASHYQKDPGQITLFNGSGAAINAIGDTFLNPEDEVLICSPTYMAYAPLPSRFGAKIVEVPALEGLYTDLDALYGGISDRTKLIFICNPNNPTGTLLNHHALKNFIYHLPEHVICVVDEAYYDWIDVPGYESAMNFIDERSKLIVLRTFSKIYGMAGCRVGFAVTNEETAKTLGTASNLFYTNRIGAAGAIDALDDTAFCKMVYRNNCEQREYMSTEMEKMGIDVAPSQASFIYFNAHCDTDKCLQELEEKHIFIRTFPASCLRVSIGRPEQNQAFLDAMKEFLIRNRKVA
ncbi:MAG: histidinol-phosphate transaminase [Butyrivibrio sp.]|jgi:histidinol-phosphate aminotransferase|nr:histidinol-phosphate transaminase [Butyrivibrio sp.]